MPWAPKRACPVCRRLNCTDPRHKREAKPRGERHLARPDFNTSNERRRRKAAVDAFLSEHGFEIRDGQRAARCPDCGQVRVKFVADHVVPIAEGGSEDGELRVHCQVCSGRQGARIRNAKRRTKNRSA